MKAIERELLTSNCVYLQKKKQGKLTVILYGVSSKPNINCEKEVQRIINTHGAG
jgi:hypothetical protein